MRVCPHWMYLPEADSAAVPGLITDILAAQPSVGVNISQEERLHTYQPCFRRLKSSSTLVKSKLGLKGLNAFCGLLLLTASLD